MSTPSDSMIVSNNCPFEKRHFSRKKPKWRSKMECDEKAASELRVWGPGNPFKLSSLLKNQ